MRADLLQRLRALHVRGRADDFVGAKVVVEVVPQLALQKIDGESCSVNFKPATVESCGGSDRGFQRSLMNGGFAPAPIRLAVVSRRPSTSQYDAVTSHCTEGSDKSFVTLGL